MKFKNEIHLEDDMGASADGDETHVNSLYENEFGEIHRKTGMKK